MKKIFHVFFVLILFVLPAHSQFVSSDNRNWTEPVNPSLINDWTAFWISYPNADAYNYGVYHFQKEIILATEPQSFKVRVSADNKYKLYVNGKFVASGPVLGDADNWFYDLIDLAPYLKLGENKIAAVVWNGGEYKPMHQISVKSAFIMQGDEKWIQMVNTNSSWRVMKNESYSPRPIKFSDVPHYIVVGAGDSIDGAKYPWSWKMDTTLAWVSPIQLEKGNPKGFGAGTSWSLVPRMIPLLEYKLQRFKEIRRTSRPINSDFINGNQRLTVQPNTTLSILIDERTIINAYPSLFFSSGKGSKIVLTYCESLVNDYGEKGNRSDIDNKIAKGIKDVVFADGGEYRQFQPLEYRTYRYLQLDISTSDSALVINDLYEMAVSYPFKENAVFESNDSSLTPIWNVGWRTARLCAMDTYMDCPYYERLQYAADTRIQALISLYVSGDDRLMRQAISMLNNSRIGEGLTQSRYPSNAQQQVIPPYSLAWVDMIYDYHMYCGDAQFIRQFFSGIQGVLDWYERQLDPNTNLLGAMKFWNFVDWTNEWPWRNSLGQGGVPPGAYQGGSAILSLQYVYTLQHAAYIFNSFGKTAQASYYTLLAQHIASAVFSKCWDVDRQLLADTPEKLNFSQHVNVLGILTNTLAVADQRLVMTRVLQDLSLTQCSYYYRFYLADAMVQAGLGDEYIPYLAPWKQALALDLTTFPEREEPTRSDCHAWSASPNYHFLATVCGITAMEPGFRKVRFAPNLGKLTEVEGKMPHPGGYIFFKMKRKGEHGIVCDVELPQGLTGQFMWKGKMKELTSGLNHLECSKSFLDN